MAARAGEASPSKFLVADSNDFLKPVGRAIDTSAVGGNASLLAME